MTKAKSDAKPPKRLPTEDASTHASQELVKTNPVDQPGEKARPDFEIAYSFDEFVGYGKAFVTNSGGSLETPGKMPWSFLFYGKSVTHENDDLYIVDGQRFKRGDIINVFATGGTTIEPPLVTFETIAPELFGFANALEDLEKIVDASIAANGGTMAQRVAALADEMKGYDPNLMSENEVRALRSLKEAARLLA